MKYIKNNFSYFAIILLLLFSIIFLSSCEYKNSDDKRLYSKEICNEKVAPFYYKNSSIESESELKDLCSCIWDKFPENSWQRKINIKLYNGEDIGWRIKSFSGMFESKYKLCINELGNHE